MDAPGLGGEVALGLDQLDGEVDARGAQLADDLEVGLVGLLRVEDAVLVAQGRDGGANPLHPLLGTLQFAHALGHGILAGAGAERVHLALALGQDRVGEVQRLLRIEGVDGEGDVPPLCSTAVWTRSCQNFTSFSMGFSGLKRENQSMSGRENIARTGRTFSMASTMGRLRM